MSSQIVNVVVENLMDNMKPPEGYNGPELVTILKEPKKDGSEAIA